MSYHTGGMRTTMGRTMSGRTTTPRTRRTTTPTTRRTTTPRRGRMMNGNGVITNGTGARGIRRTAGQFGRGGVRRATIRRPGPVVSRGRTQSNMMNRTQARGISSPGLANHGFRGVNQFGKNI